MNAVAAEQYRELELAQVRAMSGSEKFWGWVQAAGLNGHQMYVAGSDDMIALRFHHGHDYEPTTRKLWRQICRNAAIAIDVGTHSGIFSLDAYKAGAKMVMSVEPHPINYARLVMNLRKNGYGAQGVFLGAAGKENHVRMLEAREVVLCHAAGYVGEHKEGWYELPVRVARLDDLLPQVKWADVAAVKIDAENLTPDVLLGMPAILEHRPDLIIECVDDGMGANLRSLGYRFWRIWEHGLIEEVDDLIPHNPDGNYNGTDENCRNRFASAKGLPNG